MASIGLLQPVASDTTTTGTANSTTSTTGPNNELTGNSFLTLLTAQLQAQDPLNPVDPTTFMTELVQFNQLEQLININQTLSGLATGSPGTGSSTPSPSSSAVSGSSASTPAALVNEYAPIIQPSSATAIY